MPFSHDIAGGQGNLVATQVQSPNFVHGSTGWRLGKDGSLEAHDVIIPAGSGGTVVTFAATAPATPNAGDVWYNTTAGLEASVWSGSAWVPYQIGTGAIANAAISTAQLAASVTARSIGGVTTTIAASAPASPLAGDLWINSSNGYQLEQYSGSAFTPVTWNASNVIQAGTITATQIEANTITASQLAVGIVYAGIVDSTTINAATFTGSVFEGTDFVINTTAATFGANTSTQVQIESNGGTGQISFPLNDASFTDGVMNSQIPGGIYGLLELLGPGNTASGHTDIVGITFNSSDGVSSSANAELAYFSPSGSDTAYLICSAAGVTIYAGTIIAVEPGTGTPSSPAAGETWHTITLDTSWSTVSGFDAPRYRLLPDGNLQLSGAATLSASRTTAANLNSSNPLPAAYRPVNTHRFRSYDSTATARFAVQISAAGVIEGLANAGGAQIIEIDGIVPLN
jgi:hypothetical protein